MLSVHCCCRKSGTGARMAASLGLTVIHRSTSPSSSSSSSSASCSRSMSSSSKPDKQVLSPEALNRSAALAAAQLVASAAGSAFVRPLRKPIALDQRSAAVAAGSENSTRAWLAARSARMARTQAENATSTPAAADATAAAAAAATAAVGQSAAFSVSNGLRGRRAVKRNLVSTLFAPLFAPLGADAKTLSHRYLTYAGLMVQHAAGIYALTPVGLRALENVTRIICEELELVGAQRTALPMLMTKELWDKTGRWTSSGQEVFRLQDRKGRDMLLGPTHEEAVCELAATKPLGRGQFPLMLYQLDRKFRDEARPRHGLMRGREFWMKDLYTFDVDIEHAAKTYDTICGVYGRIFDRLGLDYVRAEADTGNIGGVRSHEFHVISPAGEDTLLVCSSCNHAMNEEKAVAQVAPLPSNLAVRPALSGAEVDVAEQHALMHADKLAQALGVQLVDDFVILLHRHDRKLNHLKTQRALNQARLHRLDWSKLCTVIENASVQRRVRILLDNTLTGRCTFQFASLPPNLESPVLQAFKQHLSVPDGVVKCDISEVEAGDLCRTCLTDHGRMAPLVTKLGMEVGHAFLLGQKYSQPLGVTFTNAANKRVTTEMGCYGLGVSRILAALVETQLHNAQTTIAQSPAASTTAPAGAAAAATPKHQQQTDLLTLVRWPIEVAPFAVCFSFGGLGLSDETRDKWQKVALALHDTIVRQGILPVNAMLIDDRLGASAREQARVSDVLGVPINITIDAAQLDALALDPTSGAPSLEQLGNVRFSLTHRTLLAPRAAESQSLTALELLQVLQKLVESTPPRVSQASPIV
ncbi:prolyl-tRNA synthetase [Capsaspora owczarzaki ATCC 30864]|uniref:proline--tRNA ligase n=1 Tax=Capsaspora owczarzaki (strain ATCC 30864) TaxID=595528 RepID=A0A0D2WIE5_CAPO3|nr:prolyl-tRNA synthetase [Capsaspora owczarzaki ATCC 30864]